MEIWHPCFRFCHCSTFICTVIYSNCSQDDFFLLISSNGLNVFFIIHLLKSSALFFYVRGPEGGANSLHQCRKRKCWLVKVLPSAWMRVPRSGQLRHGAGAPCVRSACASRRPRAFTVRSRAADAHAREQHGDAGVRSLFVFCATPEQRPAPFSWGFLYRHRYFTCNHDY